MILAIDAGNSDIVFALMEGEDIVHSWRHETKNKVSGEILVRGFEAAGRSPKALEGGILGSVVPAVSLDLERIFKAYTGKDLKITSGQGGDAGVEVKLDAPAGIGADRVLNIVAGIHYYGAPLIILDFGTANTFDVVDKDGAFIGGAIGAGIGISLKALHAETDLLPLIGFGEPPNIIATNAPDAMQSAAFFGTVSMIEGMVKRIRAELGGDVKTILTGGYSSYFEGKTEAIDFIRPDLTLQGLRLMFERNENG